jgi:two-component system, sensor histidine kinase and response regulator
MVAVPLPSGVNRLIEDLPRILVVDDEIHNRQLLNRILRQQAKIVEAGNAEETLNLLDREDFDLVLLDIMMPEVTGLEVLQIMRESPKTAQLPVILISALSENDDIARGLQIGANDYIAKPVDIDVVRARVNTQLKLKMMMDLDKQAIAELQAAQQMKDRLFRIASHDLKSPLSNVKMAEVLLRKHVGNDPEAAEILDTLRNTVSSMKGVIEEFLDMAACQSGNIDVHLGKVDVEQVLMAVVAQYSRVAADKDIELAVSDLVGTAHADAARLTQVLNNLVSNSIKYSPQHTTVTLWSEVYDDKVRICIADQGPGIPANERERLFKEFSTLSNRPTGNETSTGLGLWIVKHMVTLQHGTVGVECPPDGGSIFWVELPAYVN